MKIFLQSPRLIEAGPIMILSENLVALVGHLAWPATAILACWLFRRPLTRLIETLGLRIKKLSFFKLDIELGELKRAMSLSATVDRLKSAPVDESSLQTIVADVIKSGSADYLILDIGDIGDEWLTSRLFLLAALLERNRVVRVMVFLDGSKHFVGAATVRDIRISIGTRYPAYEIALGSAYGNLPSDPGIFKSGVNENLINQLSIGFLRHPLISSGIAPIPQASWVMLSAAWEFADWVTRAGLEDILGRHFWTDSVVIDTGHFGLKNIKALVHASGPFAALVGKDRVFAGICDRHAVLESIARQAVDQSGDQE